MQENRSLLEVKIAIEAVGVLRAKDLDLVMVMALGVRNYWINEEAFRACRHLPNISKELSSKVEGFIVSLSPYQLIRSREDFMFSLKLSGAYKGIYETFKMRMFDTICLALGLIFFCILYPRLAFFLLPVLYLIYRIATFSTSTLDRFMLNLIRFVLIFCFLVTIIYSRSIYSPIASYASADIMLAFSAFALSLLLPVHDIYYGITTKLKSISFYSLKLGLVVLGLSAIMLLTFFNLALLMDKYLGQSVMKGITMVITGIASCVGLFSVYRYIRDHLFVKKLKLSSEVSRHYIVDTINKINGSAGVLKFLKALESHRCHLTGHWPENITPRCHSEQGDTLLAKLEERSIFKPQS